MKRIGPDKVRNILTVRNDRFGEFLLNIPALRALKESFVNARIIAVVNPYVRELAERVSFIDEIIDWEDRKHTVHDRLSVIGLLRKKKIDMAVMLNPSREFNCFTYFAGIPVRAGYDRKLGFLLTHKMEDKKFLGRKHEIEYNLELVSLVGASTQDLSLSLMCDDIAVDLPGDFVTVHPFTSDPLKQWPYGYFRDLIKRLTAELGVQVAVIGGKEEIGSNKEYFFGFDKKVVNLVAKTSLSELAAIVRKSRLLISGDSGPVHLAGCVNTPVIALFRNDIPAKSSARWGPRSRASTVLEKDNLSKISVEEVFDKVKEALKP